MCSPLIYDEIFYKESSFFELKNIALNINIKNNINMIRNITSGSPLVTNAIAPNLTNGGRVVTAQGLNANAANGTPFGSCKFISYFLTPPLDIVQPSECVVPYMEYIRTKCQGSAVAAGATGEITSSVIPLSGVQDYIALFVNPSIYGASNQNAPFTEGNFNLAITDLSLDYGNKQNMLSSFLPMDFYKLAVSNGLSNTDWIQWSGYATVSSAGVTKQIPTVGSIILLKPGIDFPFFLYLPF